MNPHVTEACNAGLFKSTNTVCIFLFLGLWVFVGKNWSTKLRTKLFCRGAINPLIHLFSIGNSSCLLQRCCRFAIIAAFALLLQASHGGMSTMLVSAMYMCYIFYILCLVVELPWFFGSENYEEWALIFVYMESLKHEQNKNSVCIWNVLNLKYFNMVSISWFSQLQEN